MDLFEGNSENPRNLLHRDGVVQYYDDFLSAEKASKYFKHFLHHIQWMNDEAIILGKKIITKRQVAWYGDRPFAYHYSQVKKIALPWTQALLALKKQVEQKTGQTYNSCLMNLYHDGSQGMAWHSDAEKELKKHGTIASVSFGAERLFAFKHKVTQEKVSLILRHGSVLIMKGVIQEHWLHRLPPTTKVKHPRINLTFRTINSPV